MARKKGKKPLSSILDGLVKKEVDNYNEEEHLISKILENKPELRNTTARFLKKSGTISPEHTAKSKEDSKITFRNTT
jgi:hypothetical protein